MYKITGVLRSLMKFRCSYSTVSVSGLPRQYGCVTDEIHQQISTLVGSSQVSVSNAVREQHGRDESYHSVKPPDIVVFANDVDQISGVVRTCNEHKIPVIPFGTGTGLEGGVGAPFGGVCIDMSKMDEITEVCADDFYASVRPGVTRMALNKYLRETGLFFPIDPGADASLCGMAATSASGTNAVRYGTMRENVLNLEVVLASGAVLHTAGSKGRAKKSAAGYNLTNLFIGSEGTLGIITQTTLRLQGIPEATVAAVCGFPSTESAITTTVMILQLGIPVGRIEFLDDTSVLAANKFSKLDYSVCPTLFIEFSGSPVSIKEQIEVVGEIAKDNGANDFIWAEDHETRSKLWRARHEWWYAGLALEPGKKGFATDVCVPISKLPEVLLETKQDLDNSPFTAPIIGHVGDGNFHSLLLVDSENSQEIELAHQLGQRMGKRAIEAGGTCTGEHGIGRGKRNLLVEEVGSTGINTMRAIKESLDPNMIMNPGNILIETD